jgi:hypothetical protein
MCFMHDGPSKPGLRANLGLWFLRSGAATLEFMANTIAAKVQHVRMSDQAVVNALMKQGGIAPWLNPKDSPSGSKDSPSGSKDSPSGSGGFSLDSGRTLSTTQLSDAGSRGEERGKIVEGNKGGSDRSKGGGKMPMEGEAWLKMKVKILPEKVYVNGHVLMHGTSLPPEMGMAHINWTRTKGQKKKYLKQWNMWKC